MFPLFHTQLPPPLTLPASLSSPPLKFFGHLHPSINCQCSSTAINQLFVSSCQSARDLCQLLLLITRRVRLEGEKREGERETERKEETEGKLGERERGAVSWDGKDVGALRKRLKEGKEVLSVKKMNSESKVRRCA